MNFLSWCTGQSGSTAGLDHPRLSSAGLTHSPSDRVSGTSLVDDDWMLTRQWCDRAISSSSRLPGLAHTTASEGKQKHRPLEAKTCSKHYLSSTTIYFPEPIFDNYWPCNGHEYRVLRIEYIFAINSPPTSTFTSQHLHRKERVSAILSWSPYYTFMTEWLLIIGLTCILSNDWKIEFSATKCRVPVGEGHFSEATLKSCMQITLL